MFHPGPPPLPLGPHLAAPATPEWAPMRDAAADAVSAGAGRLSGGSYRWPRPNPCSL